MTYKPDLYDKKIIYELDKNASLELNNLAHKLKRSKQFVLYRMQKLEEENIITGYHAIIDMSALGYFTFRVYIKLQQMTQKDVEAFVEKIRSTFSNVWTITSMHGKWDFALFIGVKTIPEFHTIIDAIHSKYKPHIKLHDIAVYSPIHNFNRAFFLETTQDRVERIYGAGHLTTIDQLDWNIITLYAPKARVSSLALSKKLHVSADTIRKRIKKLEQNGIIVGYNLGINLEKLGYTSYRVDIQLVSTTRNKELHEHCKMHNQIYQINKTIGGADFEIEVIVKDQVHLTMLIDEIKTQFSNVINDVDYFAFSTFHVLQYIPD